MPFALQSLFGAEEAEKTVNCDGQENTEDRLVVTCFICTNW
jgi:hypothetical protein